MKNSNKKEIDLVIYISLFILLALYGVYIKGTCEELGCLAIIIPIIGIFIISGIEFIICLFIAASNNWNVTNTRAVIFTITAIISLFAAYGILRSWLG